MVFSSSLSLTMTIAFVPIPFPYRQAMEHKCWREAIETKLLALEENQAWNVVTCPSVKPLGNKQCKALFE